MTNIAVKNEFIIEDVINKYKDQQIVLIGRNCDDDVSVGNIYDLLIIRVLDSKDRETPSKDRPTLTIPINLKINSINCFNRKMPFVSQGYTALLNLTGHGINLIKPSAWGKDNAIVYLLASNKESKSI